MRNQPHVIQMEAHPYYRDEETISALAPCGCRVMAWYPLGHGDHALLEEPIVKELAEKYEKSTAQVILRWHTQVGKYRHPGFYESGAHQGKPRYLRFRTDRRRDEENGRPE